MKLTPEDLAALSPDERAALQAEDADQHLATYGDTKLAVSEEAEQDKTEAKTEAKAEAKDDPGAGEEDYDADEGEESEGGTTDAKDDAKAAPTKEEAAAALEELEAPKPAAAPAPAPVQYEVDSTDFAAQRKDLRDQKLAIHKEWSEGKLTDDEFAQRTVELDDKLADIAVAQGRAAALKEANEQHAKQQAEALAQAETEACAALAARVKDQIDYSANKFQNPAAKQFDVLLQAAKLDPENQGKPIAEVVEKVHDAMLALRGIARPAGAPAPAAAPAPKPPRDVPRTLSGIPDAAPVGVQDEALEAAGRLEGEDLERFLASLPTDKLRKVMRTADNSFFKA